MKILHVQVIITVNLKQSMEYKLDFRRTLSFLTWRYPLKDGAVRYLLEIGSARKRVFIVGGHGDFGAVYV
tara:strand:- start:1940 stop:2149 length:210 start_codon:yes stop_codon:yes gene_type:complete